MNEIIRAIEMEQLRTDIPKFSVGDTVRVQVKVVEGSRERLQAASTAPAVRLLLSAAFLTASVWSVRSPSTARVLTASP